MNLDDLYAADSSIVFEAISGSKAYGLDTPESDTDMRGLFVAPRNLFFAHEAPAQLSDAKNDITYFEIGRFVELLTKANPTALELLFTPSNCVLKNHAVMRHLDRDAFLTRQCRDTFAGYAHAQIKKARGLNKKISNPMPKERKGVLAFCFIADGQGSIPVQDWLSQQGYQNEHCGLVNVPHMPHVQAVFYDESGMQGFQGITRSKDAQSLVLSSVPKDMEPVALMSFNKDGYAKHCRQHAEYWEWVSKRNDRRFTQTIDQGKNYDAKNMMHTFRLLDMAAEIAREKTIHVRRENRAELFDIRNGIFTYEELLARAEDKLAEIDALYNGCELPEVCDSEAAKRQLVAIRTEWYT
jgi:hypothetical protein